MALPLEVHEKAYWIAFNKVPGIGAARLSALLNFFESAEAAWKASIQQLRNAELDRRSLENLLAARRTLDLNEEWEKVCRAGVTILTWPDPEYPANLRQIDAPPPLLYIRGRIEETDNLAVAIVGTRRASIYGREVARRLASELAAHGITIVSGLALGIDSVAHKATIEAKGRTLAVLGSGVDQIYPPDNRGLAKAIEQQGAIISEYPLGVRPAAGNFPPRNRIISGLSKGVIIVEAGQRSGALITARFAADHGRDVFAVPGSILHPGSVGCNELIQQGATPLLSVNDVLEQLQLVQVQSQRTVRQTAPADPMENQLLAVLSAEPAHIDDIVRRAAISSPQVASLLAIMELKGLVRQVSAMNYVLG
jgi:DNA processing protein